MTQNSYHVQSTQEVNLSSNLFAIDYLKIKVSVTNNPNLISDKVVVPYIKCDGEFTQGQESYSKKWVQGSHSSQIQIKSLNDRELLIQGNFFKWLNGQNVTGTTNLIQLVSDTIAKLCEMFDCLQPTEDELINLKQGAFQIYRIDLNKALVFESKEKAQHYLALIKEHGTYPRRERELRDNGIYFGFGSKRTTLLYYYKGNEVKSHKRQQVSLTPELRAYADLVVRCEVRLFSQQLRDNESQYGYCWNEDLVRELVESYHSSLNLPDPISDQDLPSKYVRFLATARQGALPIAYSAATIARYKRVLAKEYGVVL